MKTIRLRELALVVASPAKQSNTDSVGSRQRLNWMWLGCGRVQLKINHKMKWSSTAGIKQNHSHWFQLVFILIIMLSVGEPSTPGFDKARCFKKLGFSSSSPPPPHTHHPPAPFFLLFHFSFLFPLTKWGYPNSKLWSLIRPPWRNWGAGTEAMLGVWPYLNWLIKLS